MPNLEFDFLKLPVLKATSTHGLEPKRVELGGAWARRIRFLNSVYGDSLLNRSFDRPDLEDLSETQKNRNFDQKLYPYLVLATGAFCKHRAPISTNLRVLPRHLKKPRAPEVYSNGKTRRWLRNHV